MLTAGGGVVWLRDIVSVVTKNGRPVKLRGIMVDITARVQAEQALKQNEKRFRLLYEQAPLAYQTLDEAGHLIEVNQAWLDLLGYSRPDVIGRSFGDFLTPPSVDLFTKRFPRFKATGRVRSARFQMVRRDGTGVTVSLDGSIGYDRTGNFKQTHCILHNITELEQMADALRESDERLYSTIRSMDDMLFVLDENGVFVDYYQKDQEHDLYAPPEMFLGKSYRDVLPPHVVKLMEPAIRAVRAAVSVQEFDYYLDMPGRGRQWYNARLSPRKDRRGQFAGITVVARNVTDRVLAEQTIKESEARFRSLVDSMDERIFLLDRDHRITGVFGGWLEKFQIDPQVFTGKTLDEIFEPDMARLQIEAQKKALAGEHTVFDWTLAGTPAGTLHFRGSVSPLRNAQGEITGTVSVGHDITDRVLAEQAEREQRRLAETLRDVTLALAARIETGAVLDEILQQARRLVDYSTANIILLQQDTLRVVRHRGYETFGGADMMEGLTIPLQTFPLNVEAARTHRPVLVPDTAEEPRWVQFPGTEWIKTCLMLPLVHGERVLGFLNFDADTPGAFSPADAERLQPLAAAAAVALNNARLLAETGKRAGQMALVHTLTRQITPLLDVGSLLRTAVEALQTRFGYLSVQMYILDHEAGELEARAVAGKAGLVEPGYRQKVGQGITGRAAARGEQVLVPDVSAEPGFIACVPGIRSELVLPVWCAGQLAGVLNIESDRLNGFDEADIVALEALAGQLGAVLENARRAAQLEALREIGLEISAQLELNRVLESIVRRAIELLNGSSGGMYLYRPRQDALEWTVAIGKNLAPTGTLLRRGEGVSGKVLATNAPLVVDDYHHWEGRAEIYAGYPVTSVVGVPVRWGEEFLGVLDVLADCVGAFSEDDVALLNLLAAQAAVAVHNARLYEQARRDAETKATLL
ncbi:MAG: GAF domain-containing protein, partial [Anaerolineae bacterium]